MNKNKTIGYFVGGLSTVVLTGIVTTVGRLDQGSSILLASILGATLTHYVSNYIQGRMK